MLSLSFAATFFLLITKSSIMWMTISCLITFLCSAANSCRLLKGPFKKFLWIIKMWWSWSSWSIRRGMLKQRKFSMACWRGLHSSSCQTKRKNSRSSIIQLLYTKCCSTNIWSNYLYENIEYVDCICINLGRSHIFNQYFKKFNRELN